MLFLHKQQTSNFPDESGFRMHYANHQFTSPVLNVTIKSGKKITENAIFKVCVTQINKCVLFPTYLYEYP